MNSYIASTTDDIKFEVAMGTNHPPGTKGGQHVSMGFAWLRRWPDGEWFRGESNGMHRTILDIEKSHSSDEWLRGE